MLSGIDSTWNYTNDMSAKKKLLIDFFESRWQYDVWLSLLKPWQHARVTNSGRLIVKPYGRRKVQVGGGRYFIT